MSNKDLSFSFSIFLSVKQDMILLNSLFNFTLSKLQLSHIRFIFSVVRPLKSFSLLKIIFLIVISLSI